MHIHILGICGTFMAGIAILAKQLGHDVSGSDANVYPPMSDQLKAQGITLCNGYDPEHLTPVPDCVIVGNAMKRGNPMVEHLLNENIPYISGPQWLAEQVLRGRHVLAVAGTHGKTTTSSLLAWILECAGLHPGFLIGGVPENFGVSARLGKAPFFVMEADEYDSAFFDKRSKFIHYHPRTLILNNLEFDHADIFPNLEAIKQQCHFLLRTIPSNGLLIAPADDSNVADVLQRGCWTPVEYFGMNNAKWRAVMTHASGNQFDIYHDDKLVGAVSWELLGQHNILNALAALAAAHHVGVEIERAIGALTGFQNVKRRMEVKGQVRGITVYDDFAHHPTAIATTLAGLRGKVGKERIVAVLELGSYTMRTGVHKDHLAAALKEADHVLFARPNADDWGINEVVAALSVPAKVYDGVSSLIDDLTRSVKSGDHILIMSNAGFDGIHQKLLVALKEMT